MATVTVGCKLSNGIIIELGDKRVTLNGTNASTIIGGHGITEGVDKEFFDAWMTKYAELQFVKDGLLFAHEKASNTAAEAKDKKKAVTGFEGMDPKKKPSGLTELA